MALIKTGVRVNPLTLWIGVPLAIIAGCAGLSFVGCIAVDNAWQIRWTDARLKESEQIGDTVVNAISAYRREQGKLPATLNDLAPQYLDSVPAPTAGTCVWEYNPKDGHYELAVTSFSFAGYPRLTYSSKAKFWLKSGRPGS